MSLKRTQREVVKSVVEVIGAWEVKGIEKIEVVLKVPETEWSQVQALVPLYGLKFRGWRCWIKEGEGRLGKVLSGSEWDTRLRELYRKEGEML